MYVMFMFVQSNQKSCPFITIILNSYEAEFIEGSKNIYEKFHFLLHQISENLFQLF
jgi:hypothetical protein